MRVGSTASHVVSRPCGPVLRAVAAARKGAASSSRHCSSPARPRPPGQAGLGRGGRAHHPPAGGAGGVEVALERVVARGAQVARRRGVDRADRRRGEDHAGALKVAGEGSGGVEESASGLAAARRRRDAELDLAAGLEAQPRLVGPAGGGATDPLRGGAAAVEEVHREELVRDGDVGGAGAAGQLGAEQPGDLGADGSRVHGIS